MVLEATKSGPVVMTRRGTFTHRDNSMVAIEVSSGDIEIYQVDPADGIEMFLGYIHDSKICGALRVGATMALYIARPNFVREVQLTLDLAAA